MEIVQWFLGASDGIVNALVYVVIILIFLSGLFRCIFPVMRIKSVIKKAIRSIKQGSGSKRSWQEDKFLGKGTLFPHWSEYLNNLFFADGVYHNASNVEDYINEETAIYGPGRSSFAEAIPGLLVSLGFLGTLIGLSVGLSGFRMTDTEAVQQSIVTLIPGMRYAFMTSIFGVVGSVSFTLITRFTYGSAEHTLKDFYGAMSRYAGVLSVDPMTQIAIYQQEQTALIQTMAQDLNGQFTDRLAEILDGAMTPVAESLESFLSVTSQQQARMIDKVTARFIERLNESLDGQFKNLSQVIAETCKNQETATDVVLRGMRDAESVLKNASLLEKNLEGMVKSLEEYMGKLSRSQAQTDDSYLRIAANVEKMELVSSQQNAYLKSVSAMHAEVSRAVKDLQDSEKALLTRFRDMSAESAAGMLKAAGEIRATGAMLESNRQRIGEQLKVDLTDTLDSFRDYMGEFTKRVDYLTQGIGQTLDQLPRVVGQSTDLFLDQIDRISDTLQKSQRALDEAVDRLYPRQ